jgi:hypothetical protein
MKDNLQIANKYKYDSISGRYVTAEHVDLFFETLTSKFKITTIGYSVQNKAIKAIQFGEGAIKILVWSQMHGNESTTTKGLIDYLHYLHHNEKEFENLSKSFSFYIIPILNPDGAAAYTRENANGVDLNRDAFACTQPESMVLKTSLDTFNPDYCFNLHDQRSIFGLLESQKPATMSFLAPSYNEEQTFNKVRVNASAVIVGIYIELQKYIPNKIGRFEDSFNINCTGDYFTNRGYATILFEAGHYTNDYNRDEVRKFVFISLKAAISFINENVIVDNDLQNYLNIYQNNKCFYDLIFKNVRIYDNNVEKFIKFAVQYKEVLQAGKIKFIPEVVQIGNLESFFAHQTIDFENKLYEFEKRNFPEIGDIIKV